MTTAMDYALVDVHRKQLTEGSGISEEIISARGYRSITKRAELELLGFGKTQSRIPALLIPLWNVAGAIENYQARPNTPRVKLGKPIKYEMPKGSGVVLDVHPSMREHLADPERVLVITEGIKKADAASARGLCTVGLLGVDAWRGKNSLGGLTALAGWESIALNHRKTYIVFDSDVATKPQVRKALLRLKVFLESRKAEVFVVYLPSAAGGVKTGLDDYFARDGWDVDDLLALASTEVKPSSDPELPDQDLDREKYTDSGNAKRLVEKSGGDFRFVYGWNKWLGWDKRRWNREADGRLLRAAKETARGIFDEAKTSENERGLLADHAMKSLHVGRLEAMIKLSRCELETTPAELDIDPWALNCPNGTLDLRTNELRPHERDDFLTKLCPTHYDPAAKAPTWEASLARIMPNPAMIAYFKRIMGYGLCASVKEDALFFMYGTGANGKTTVLNAIRDTVGPDYSHECAPELLLAKKNEAHPTEVADLWGRRIVTTIEVEQGRKLAEVMVKKLTGRDPLTARRMREDFWSFNPTHKIYLAANYKPTIEGTDTAIWRRIRLVPFTVTIPKDERDTELGEKLKAERKGILAWLVEGCLEWQKIGLADPPEVLAAVQEYQAEMDVLANFIAECCIVAPQVRVTPSGIYNSYVAWHKRIEGGEPMSQKAFGTALANRGYQSDRDGSSRWWRGVAVKQDEPGSNG